MAEPIDSHMLESRAGEQDPAEGAASLGQKAPPVHRRRAHCWILIRTFMTFSETGEP